MTAGLPNRGLLFLREKTQLIKSGGGNVKEIVVLNDTGRKILTNGKSYFKLERGLKKCKN